MGYDRGDSFHFDFESNGLQFGSKLKGKLYGVLEIDKCVATLINNSRYVCFQNIWTSQD